MGYELASDYTCEAIVCLDNCATCSASGECDVCDAGYYYDSFTPTCEACT